MRRLKSQVLKYAKIAGTPLSSDRAEQYTEITADAAWGMPERAVQAESWLPVTELSQMTHSMHS